MLCTHSLVNTLLGCRTLCLANLGEVEWAGKLRPSELVRMKQSLLGHPQMTAQSASHKTSGKQLVLTA